MKKNKFLINKYTLCALILLFCMGLDIFFHKGMTRVLLPESFTDKKIAQNCARCEQPLQVTGKEWVKAVNTVERIKQLSPDAPGFELDVYFDTSKNYLQVYHDSSGYSELNIESILDVYKARNLSSSVWLDFKNLSSINEIKSLTYISLLSKKYRLHNKLIVESSFPQFLQSFCDSGFYTSYYTPYFNPYQLSEDKLMSIIDTISSNLKRFPTSALSGYYFQYPFLKKYFPNYSVLTWADKTKLSIISKVFNRMIRDDGQVKIILYPE